MNVKLTGVIITLNESENIGRCIESIRSLCEEIIVIDSGSTDDTVSIARNLGAQVFKINWLGYGQTKNFGNMKARNDWILSLDADEVVDEALRQSIRAIKPQRQNEVYQLNRVSFYEGRWIKHSGWYPDWCNRIFHRGNADWSEDHVHEKLTFNQPPVFHKLDGHLEHYSYTSEADHLNKIEKYARLKAMSWIESGGKPSFWKRYFGPAFKYFKTLYIDQGYKDGDSGKQIARLNRLLIRKQIEYYDALRRSQ